MLHIKDTFVLCVNGNGRRCYNVEDPIAQK